MKSDRIEARCGKCSTVWKVADLPMPLDQCGKAMLAARCPKGCNDKVYLA